MKAHPELSGCITTLMEVANFGAAIDTLIDQDDEGWVYVMTVCHHHH